MLARSGNAAAGISTSIAVRCAARGRPAAICPVPLKRLPLFNGWRQLFEGLPARLSIHALRVGEARDVVEGRRRPAVRADC